MLRDFLSLLSAKMWLTVGACRASHRGYLAQRNSNNFFYFCLLFCDQDLEL